MTDQLTHPAAASLAQRFPRGWVEPAVIAEEMDLHYQTVLKWTKSGELPAFDVGGRGRGPYRVYLTEFDNFLRARQTTTAPVAPAVQSEPAPSPAPERPRAPRRGARRAPTTLIPT